jgi:ATP-dependent RNA helicase DDX3X
MLPPVGDGRGAAGAANATTTTTSNTNNGNNPSNKVDRRAGKRAKQLETMEKKALTEDAYFRKCLQEARQRNVANGGGSTDVKTKEELFGQQGMQGINFDKYNDIKVEVRPPSGIPSSETTTIQAMDSFDSLMLNNAQLQSNVKAMNYKQPTPIQRYAIPLALAGKDLMCCAQTGSGKTCAFLLPIIAALANNTNATNNNSHQKQHAQGNKNNNASSSSSSAKPVCIILAPTRELASQIELEAQKLTHGMSRIIQPVCVYGGANPKSQLRDLAFATSATAVALLVVATPGRLMDFCDRALITLGNVKFLVLDEADRMLV